MVNAGAIVTTGLIARATPRDAARPRARGVRRLRRPGAHDRRGGVPVGAARPAIATARIAFLMKSFGVLDGDVEAAVDLYFKQCSLLVDGRDLAMMAATLANRGVNPITGRARRSRRSTSRTSSA